MNLLSSPPTDPGQVVVVVQRIGAKILAATFKYKKGKWSGVVTGDKYTTEELVGTSTEAYWLVSPLQPIYTKETQ